MESEVERHRHQTGRSSVGENETVTVSKQRKTTWNKDKCEWINDEHECPHANEQL